jgi:hypothetical protein
VHSPFLARLARRFGGSVIVLALVGCTSGSSAPSSSADADPDPPSSAGDAASKASPGTCLPTIGDTGNSKNVGAYCTKGGGQCSDYPNTSLQCSSDLSAQGGNFCLFLGCTLDTDCGEDACCTSPAGSGIHACIPIGCFDSGVCSSQAP